MTGNEIRKAFLDFFVSKQHTIVASAPMVIKNDPTLMFTNAGMNQFKDIFLGNVPKKYNRIADTQKCLRVSGKHNDLEEVGIDTYHHTMFEMLGNWSFGDYFKKEAIAWSWELLTEVYKLDAKSLYVTIFGGDKADNQSRDIEALEYWKTHISEDRILDGSKKDNFWEMGEQGPCGPCSEIHIDLRSDEEKQAVSGRELVNKDHPLVVEVWNLVFMQYNRLADGSLVPLSESHIDTGMGFERLCMAVQNKKSNYDTDIFQPLILSLAERSGKTYGQHLETDVALRVCADHIRAVAFAIADGQLPSNAKAGYVIRRILRRAVRYGYTFLGFDTPFMYELGAILAAQLGHQFPELESQKEMIARVVFEEEQSFLRTLSNGIHKFENYIARQASSTKKVDGDFAFELFDTYGFPIDLTELMAKEKGWTVDMDAFRIRLDEQRARSRQAASSSMDDWLVLREEGQTQFVGFDRLKQEVHISKYRKVTNKDKTLYQLVFDQTPFYPEMGGQVGDTGYLEAAGERIEILDTRQENNLHFHLVAKLPKDPTVLFEAVVDQSKRLGAERNHTATHLLHYALREVLGKHVEQKGSLVTADRLRFDFSHFSKITSEEMRKVEEMVNQMIRDDLSQIECRKISMEEAQKKGAMALFSEKYEDEVRVIQFGDSVELCGGTHVDQTARIGLFKIVSEGAIAAGIRRIEAITGKQTETYFYKTVDTLTAIEDLLEKPKETLVAFRKVLDENEELREQIKAFKKDQMANCFETLKTEISTFGDLSLIEFLPPTPIDADSMKDLAFRFRNYKERLAFVAGSINEGKPILTLMLSDDLVAEGKNAGNIIREAAKKIQGGGGGQPFFATAGGRNVQGLSDAVAQIKDLLTK